MIFHYTVNLTMGNQLSTKVSTTFIHTYSDLLDIFKLCNIQFNKLPVLDLGDKVGKTDYIDFLTPKDMSENKIVKFTDCYNRKGVAFLITEIETKKQNVLAIFERYTNEEKLTYGWGNSNRYIELKCQDIHKIDCNSNDSITACDNCPFVSGGYINKLFLQNLIQDKNTFFKLGN